MKAMQERVARASRRRDALAPLSVRIGLSAGEVNRGCHLFVKSESNGKADECSDRLATLPRGDEAGALKRLLCLAIKLLPAAR